jgi:1-phosphofructokinase
MVAGFLAGWLASQDYDYALRLGVAAGSATAFSLDLAAYDGVMDCLRKIK